MFTLFSKARLATAAFTNPGLRNLSKLFVNKKSEQIVRPFRRVTVDELSINETGSHQLIFVISQNDELVMSQDRRSFCMLTGFSTSEWHHSDLANLQPVKAAGEINILIKNGKVFVTAANNQSGHYQPSGEHLKELVETVLEQNGFLDAKGKYTNFHAFTPGQPEPSFAKPSM